MRKLIKEEAVVVDTTLAGEEIGSLHPDYTEVKQMQDRLSMLFKKAKVYENSPELLAKVYKEINSITGKLAFKQDQFAKMNTTPILHKQAPLPPAMESFTSEKALLEDLRRTLDNN